MSGKKVKVGLVGFGVVGSGVAKIILDSSKEIQAKTGISLELACVVDKDITTKRSVELPDGILTDNVDALLNDESIDIAVELVGGTTFAKDLQIKMLNSGKDVVTANKALLAKFGNEIYKAAKENKKSVAFEASCAGGIPIILAIRNGLTANNITGLYGIVNGTCNYILSSMTNDGVDFSDALSQAQKKGFAEADPTLDINGHDSAHKLVIMASFAFGCEIQMEDIHIEGIEGISIDDIKYASEMGYVLKLLAIGEHDEDGKISLRVHPSFIQKDDALARVNGSFNAISLFGDSVGHTMYYGRGAGMMPTASAVVADIIDVAMGNSQTTFDCLKLDSRSEAVKRIVPVDQLVSRFYIKLMAVDKPGVFAKYGEILGKHDISISGALQHEAADPNGDTVPVVILTHLSQQSKIYAAIEEIQQLDIISGQPVCIRIVDIPEDKD